mgnify:CR=1 FL=1
MGLLAPLNPPSIIPRQGYGTGEGDSRSDVRRAQEQALTVVGQHYTFMEAVSLLAASHLANKCKSKGEKPRNKDRDLLYQFLYQREEKW